MVKISWRNEEVLQCVKEERNILQAKKKKNTRRRKLTRLVTRTVGTPRKHVIGGKIN